MPATRISADVRQDIADLYAVYAMLLDEARYDEWLDLFTEDCEYVVRSRENHDRGLPLATLAFESKGMLRDRIYGITQTLFHEPYYQRHVISSLLCTEQGAGYEVRANYVVIRTKAGNLPEVYSVGRYLDRVVFEDGRPKFASKVAIFDSELIANSMIYPI
jgi:salicylate 5-hydroxylase small subunit